MIQPPPTSTLFPYTTLFRSGQDRLEKAKWPLEPTSPRSPRTSKQHKRLSSNTASQGRLSTTEDRPSSADSIDRKSTRLNSSHSSISYAVFCLKKKKNNKQKK